MKKESFKIILKEHASLMRVRIIDLLKPLGIELIECGTEKVILNKLKENSKDVCCIILHIDEIENFNIVNNIREKNDKVPVVVLTTSKKRNFHIKGIQVGVNDFILIPFKDNTLFSKVQRYIDEKRNSYIELIAFNFENYIQGEIRKAQKGSFPISLMFTTLIVDKESDFKPDKIENNYYANIYFNEIKKLFWKTDIFIRFHTRFFLGVFPFCDKENSQVIKDKIIEKFVYLEKERMIPTAFKPVITFVSYPEDSDDIIELQNILYNKSVEKEAELSIKWFKEYNSGN